LTIVEDKLNPVIGRREIVFEAYHGQASTPSRVEVKEKLVAMLNADSSALIIEEMKTKINSWRTVGLAYLYDSAERAKKFTPKHKLLKELPKEEREKILKAEKKAEKK
jgi:small subunit ribosomal protein S24e